MHWKGRGQFRIQWRSWSRAHLSPKALQRIILFRFLAKAQGWYRNFIFWWRMIYTSIWSNNCELITWFAHYIKKQNTVDKNYSENNHIYPFIRLKSRYSLSSCSPRDRTTAFEAQTLNLDSRGILICPNILGNVGGFDWNELEDRKCTCFLTLRRARDVFKAVREVKLNRSWYQKGNILPN